MPGNLTKTSPHPTYCVKYLITWCARSSLTLFFLRMVFVSASSTDHGHLGCKFMWRERPRAWVVKYLRFCLNVFIWFIWASSGWLFAYKVCSRFLIFVVHSPKKRPNPGLADVQHSSAEESTRNVEACSWQMQSQYGTWQHVFLSMRNFHAEFMDSFHVRWIEGISMYESLPKRPEISKSCRVSHQAIVSSLITWGCVEANWIARKPSNSKQKMMVKKIQICHCYAIISYLSLVCQLD